MTFTIERLRTAVDGRSFRGDFDWTTDSTSLHIRVYANDYLGCEHRMRQEIQALIHYLSGEEPKGISRER